MSLSACSGFTLLRADVARLPFATGSLAAVHAGAAIHCWPDPTAAVSLPPVAVDMKYAASCPHHVRSTTLLKGDCIVHCGDAGTLGRVFSNHLSSCSVPHDYRFN